MAMPLYTQTDRQRLSDLWAAAEAAARAASLPSGFDRVYDPGMSFEDPALSTDPAAPTLFGTWGFAPNAIDTFDPESAPSRELFIKTRIFCQRAKIQGSTLGYLETAASELWRELQDASVSGLGAVVTQSLVYQVMPLQWNDWAEVQMDFKLMSTG